MSLVQKAEPDSLVLAAIAICRSRLGPVVTALVVAATGRLKKYPPTLESNGCLLRR